MFDRHLMRKVAFSSFGIDSAFNFNDVTKKVDYRHLPLYLAIYAWKGKHARATKKKSEKVSRYCTFENWPTQGHWTLCKCMEFKSICYICSRKVYISRKWGELISKGEFLYLSTCDFTWHFFNCAIFFMKRFHENVALWKKECFFKKDFIVSIGTQEWSSKSFFFYVYKLLCLSKGR